MERCGDERTLIVLQRRIGGLKCLHCSQPDHDHTTCPQRPCYTCGSSGHLVRECPHRRRAISRAETQQVAAATAQTARKLVLSHVRRAELGLNVQRSPPNVPSRQLDARARARFDRAHERRITALSWMPRGRRVVSGDKRGNVALTDVGARAGSGQFELRLSTARIHQVNVTGLCFEGDDILWSGSYDGRVLRSNLECILPGAVNAKGETAADPAPIVTTDAVLNLNPQGWNGPSKWRSVTAIANTSSAASSPTVYAANCRGALYTLDARTSSPADEQHGIHGKKIQCVQVNPVQPNLILTTSNDCNLMLWDARKLTSEHAIAKYHHPKCPFGATFSPNTGSKVVTTCHDNRIRIWDDVNVLVGDCNEREVAKPAEMVHSQNFIRYLSPFTPEFDPKDWTDDLFLVGRYLGDAYSTQTDSGPREEVLHPVDMFSASRREIVGELVDLSVSTRCPLNRFSPTEDILVSGTSLHLVFWAPKNQNAKNSDKDDHVQRSHRPAGGGGNDDDNDDEDGPGPKKKQKLVVVKKKSSTRSTRRSTRGTAKT